MKMNDHDTHMIAPHLLDDLTMELEHIIELHEGEQRPALDRRLSRIVDVAQSRQRDAAWISMKANTPCRQFAT